MLHADLGGGIKGSPVTSVSCVKKEKLEKPFLWGHENKSCTHTIVTSTSSMQEIHVECSREKSKSSGTVRIEAMNSENIKGSIQMTTTSGEKTMNLAAQPAPRSSARTFACRVPTPGDAGMRNLDNRFMPVLAYNDCSAGKAGTPA
jgi:uncharacterized protein DUF3617